MMKNVSINFVRNFVPNVRMDFISKNQILLFLYSVDTKGSSDEEALLNEHILKILQSIQKPFHEKDLPMIETQLQ